MTRRTSLELELSKARPKNAADFGQFGNAAAMRDVLVDVYNTLEKLQPYALQINDISLRRGFRGRLCHAKNVIDTALSAPPRNCDLPLTVDGPANNNADKAWIVFKRHNPDAYFDVPGLLRCIDWLLATAAAKSAKL